MRRDKTACVRALFPSFLALPEREKEREERRLFPSFLLERERDTSDEGENLGRGCVQDSLEGEERDGEH